MNHLKLSSLFIFTVCALVVVTMALPVYRAYAPAIKAPEARPPKPSTSEPRPGEDQCRARLLALAQAILVYRSENGHLPWNIRHLSVPAVCPTSGKRYLFTPGEWFSLEVVDPQSLAKFRDLVDNQIDWNRVRIAYCDWHLDTSKVDGWWWNDAENDWCPMEFDETNDPGGTLGVTLTPSVGYIMEDASTYSLINQFYIRDVRLKPPPDPGQEQ
jgi:hypothetical protein